MSHGAIAHGLSLCAQRMLKAVNRWRAITFACHVSWLYSHHFDFFVSFVWTKWKSPWVSSACSL